MQNSMCGQSKLLYILIVCVWRSCGVYCGLMGKLYAECLYSTSGLLWCTLLSITPRSYQTMLGQHRNGGTQKKIVNFKPILGLNLQDSKCWYPAWIPSTQKILIQILFQHFRWLAIIKQNNWLNVCYVVIKPNCPSHHIVKYSDPKCVYFIKILTYELWNKRGVKNAYSR